MCKETLHFCKAVNMDSVKKMNSSCVRRCCLDISIGRADSLARNTLYHNELRKPRAAKGEHAVSTKCYVSVT